MLTGYTGRTEKVLARIDELAAISEDATCITRTFGTPAFMGGCQLVKSWMLEAGLEVRIDNIGNVRGRFNSNNPQAKTLVLASHIDTVINAGRFDGPLGVIMSIDIVEQLLKEKTDLPFNIEVIAFSDEEGVRFHTTYLGSRVVTGLFDDEMLEIKDHQQVSLKEAITSMGGDCTLLKNDALPREEVLAYFEIHIEQGPVLYERHVPVAVVTAIAGQERAELSFTGVAGHAGTVPMNMRQDALCTAADFILALEAYANKTSELLATVGKINVPNAASNVIAGAATCSVDIRSADENILKKAVDEIKHLCEVICTKRNITYEWKSIQGMKPVTCDADISSLLKKSVAANEYEVIELVSGAGHDAVLVSQVAPVCMMFVRCFKGISHNPLENVEQSDIEAALVVTDDFLERLIERVKI